VILQGEEYELLEEYSPSASWLQARAMNGFASDFLYAYGLIS